MKRVRLTIAGLCCIALAGCVEGEMTYTINPDGAAKIRMEVVTVPPPVITSGPINPSAKKPQDETIDDMLRKSVRGMLDHPKVVAWKDVSAQFLPNGKFKFGGTAYVRQLSDFTKKGGHTLFSSDFKFERTTTGGLTITRREDSSTEAPGPRDPNKRKPKTPDEIKKMTDAELDTEILRNLIELQGVKGIMIALMTDAKLKTTFVLPGDVTAATGFTKDGRKASYMLDGAQIIGELNKFLAEDRDSLRKVYRGATGPDAIKRRILGDAMTEGSLTVANSGGPQFDFDKEVKEALAAYPELRKKFGFGDDLKLPGEVPPKK